MGEIKKGPNPIEITNWGEEYVLPTMRFQPPSRASLLD
jgi:hypothetical protein